MEKASRPGVYAIKNIRNGRIYIGSTARTISVRWSEHKKELRKGCHHSVFLQRSWDRHGEEAFVFFVLEVVEDYGALLAREQHWIDHLKAANKRFGFNMSPSAESCAGYRHSLAARRKMAAAKIGRRASEKTRAKMSVSHTGRTLADETRTKISQALAGRKRRPSSPESNAKRSKSLIGRGTSDETRARISAAKSTVYVVDGRSMSVADAAKICGVSAGAIHHRIRNGWELSAALTTPRARRAS